MDRQARIYVAGAETLIGAAILRVLKQQGYHAIITEIENSIDLRNSEQVNAFFEQNQPEYIFFAAGKSGGIHANQTYPAYLMIDNLLTESHVIQSAYRFGVRKLLYLA